MADLLELAPRVGVELAVAGHEVEILEQRDRHPARNLGVGARVVLHAATLARSPADQPALASAAWRARKARVLTAATETPSSRAISVSVRPSP